MDISILISCFALFISIIFLLWNIISEHAKSKAQLEVWERGSFYYGCNDNRTKISLLFRNLSHRPTAVVDIYVREDTGILGGSGYNNQIALPLKIEPWGIIKADFRIEIGDEKRMNNILVKDIDGNDITLISKSNQTWVKSKSKKQKVLTNLRKYLGTLITKESIK